MNKLLENYIKEFVFEILKEEQNQNLNEVKTRTVLGLAANLLAMPLLGYFIDDDEIKDLANKPNIEQNYKQKNNKIVANAIRGALNGVDLSTKQTDKELVKDISTNLNREVNGLGTLFSQLIKKADSSRYSTDAKIFDENEFNEFIQKQADFPDLTEKEFSEEKEKKAELFKSGEEIVSSLMGEDIPDINDLDPKHLLDFADDLFNEDFIRNYAKQKHLNGSVDSSALDEYITGLKNKIDSLEDIEGSQETKKRLNKSYDAIQNLDYLVDEYSNTDNDQLDFERLQRNLDDLVKEGVPEELVNLYSDIAEKKYNQNFDN